MGLRSPWFIAGSLVRDIAALNRMEMLPRGCPGPRLDGTAPAFFDDRARLARVPDDTFDELGSRFATEAALRVPERGRNAPLGLDEPARDSPGAQET